MGFDKFYRPVVVKGGTKAYNFWIASWTGTPSSVAANKVEEQEWTVTGVNGTYDVVLSVNPPGVNDDCGAPVARVSDDNKIHVSFANPTAGTATPEAGTYKIVLIRQGA